MVSRAIVLAAATASACLAPALDEAPDGTFACDGDGDCPDAHVCQLGRCWSGQAPRLEIRTPEADEVLAAVAEDSTGTRVLVVGLGGTGLELVDPHDDGAAALGQGMVEVVVDGEVQATVTQGDLVSGIGVEVAMADVPGAHRIAARALRADGTRYANPGAFATQLVWIDDWRAHVAIVRPWPGERLPSDETDIEIEVASLNFVFAATESTGTDPYGHAHVHLDAEFPACVTEPSCDCCYLAVAMTTGGESRRAVGVGVLPAADAGPTTLTAVLRTTGHQPFVDVDLRHVYDTIELERAAPAGQGDD
jgi:hypothetical protein